MTKKLTYEYVKSRFEEEGYELLSKRYINCNTKLVYRCNKGHVHRINWDKWKQGRRCPYCSKKAPLTYNKIKCTFELIGWKLLSKDFTTNKTKLEIMCKHKHIFFITYANFISGKSCPYCSKKKKPTIKEVRQFFKKEGYILLSKKYINNKTKLDYICSKGHKHSIGWDSFNRGTRCPTCAGVSKPNFKEVENCFDKEGYTLVSKEYKNNNSELDYICPKGHKCSTTWANFSNNVRCPKCAKTSRPTYEYIQKKFKNSDYILLSDKYINSRQYLEYICSKGHKNSMSWANFNNNKRCPDCAKINMLGENHPNWRGGDKNYCPIWSDKDYKLDIRNRDNNICQNPYCYKQDKRLHIHHIDYNKKNCRLNNLLTVCGSCNSRANFDRRWHTEWYQAIVSKKYNYKY